MVTLLTSLGVVAVATAVSVGAFLLVGRIVPAKVRAQHNDVAGYIYAFVGPLYAILLAFVVFVVWGYFNDARAAASSEATALYQVFSLSRSMGAGYDTRIQRLAIAYGESVINVEWPAMSRGEVQSPETRATFVALHEAVESYEPASMHQSDLFQQELANTDELAGARSQRILKAENDLNAPFWIALIAGAVVSVAYSFIFGLENRLAHALMVATLAFLISGMLMLIQIINQPYRGEMRVQPTAMEDTLSILQAPPAPEQPP